MKSSIAMDNIAMSAGKRRLVLAAIAALAFSVLGMATRADGDELSKETKACLTCHDNEAMAIPLENKEILSLHVSTKAYLESMHKEIGCEDCHSDIEAKTHPKGKPSIKSKRDLSVAMRDACSTCHKKKVTEYGDSVHAALIKDGSQKAPLCSDCHNPHTQLSVKIVGPIAATPCARCHQAIFSAYSSDVHGQERAAKGKAAPLCADCHQAHAVKAASLGTGVRDACLACHTNAVALHKDWLPNTERHFDAISCPACHAPNAQRRVNLRLYDGLEKQQVSEKTGVPRFERLTDAADTKQMGLDERALWSLLKEFNRDGGEGNTTLRGRLEVRSGVEAHQIAEKSRAIKECNTCHQAGAAPFQSVTLTIAGPDGRPLRHGVQTEVLNSLTSMESVRGFYAIGGTRIKLLDTLLVLVTLGALSVPLVHMTVKWLFRRERAKLQAERTAAIAQAGARDSPDDRRPGDDAST